MAYKVWVYLKIYLDASFAPTSGIKHLYPELEMFSIRQDLGQKNTGYAMCPRFNNFQNRSQL